MLELHEVSLIKGSGANQQGILHQFSAQFPAGHCVALLGASGAGIASLLKVMAGILPASHGTLSWNEPGRVREAYPGHAAIGFVSKGNEPRPFLTVSESIQESVGLRVRGLSEAERRERVAQILDEVGLGNVGGELVDSISDEKRCRLKLGIELVSPLKVLVCEAIARGLDPRSELEILKLLHSIAAERKCLVLIAPGNLRNLELFDTLAVVHEGHLVYHGPWEFLLHYFNIASPEGLFLRLSQRRANEWHTSWIKHRTAYYAALKEPAIRSDEAKEESVVTGNGQIGAKQSQASPASGRERLSARNNGSAFSQVKTLLWRHWKEMTRKPARLLLRLALIIGLPCLPIIFVWHDLSRLINPWEAALGRSPDLNALVSGVVMAQAVLLAFAGAMNGSSCFADGRNRFEKEKFSGVRPFCWVVSQSIYLAGLAAVQAFWMTFFVKTICLLPGDLLMQAGFLFFVTFTLSLLCMGISAVLKSRETARIAALYAAVIQLPLTGSLLALPDQVSRVTRLIDPVYWGWAGYLQNLWGQCELGAVRLPQGSWCFGVLGIQCLLGFCLAWFGARRNLWVP